MANFVPASFTTLYQWAYDKPQGTVVGYSSLPTRCPIAQYYKGHGFVEASIGYYLILSRTTNSCDVVTDKHPHGIVIDYIDNHAPVGSPITREFFLSVLQTVMTGGNKVKRLQEVW